MRVHAVAGPKDARLSVGPKDARLSVTLAYDAIAAGYDEQVRGDEWMRRALHAHYRRAFSPGHYVLDVGCGTGIDALFLAGLGARVLGVDGSTEMIARTHDRLTHDKLTGGGAATAIETRLLAIENLGQLADEGPFDGLVSAFASLNSLCDLAGFADDAARLVRPGGRMVLHVLNRFSAWEWLGCVAHHQWAAAGKVGRLATREFVIGDQSVQHSLYFPADAYRRFFQTAFEKRDAYSLGAVRPPHTVRRIPRGVVKTLEWADVRLGRWPLLNDAGRFFVLDLERRGFT